MARSERPRRVQDVLDRGGATDTRTVTVASGDSLSAAVDLEGFKLAGIVTPSAIDSATSLTFQVCATVDGTFMDLYDDFGVEATVTVSTSRGVGVDGIAGVLASWRYLKVRLGTSASATTATADRTLTLVLKS